jgi:hypothetical protein
MKRRSFCEGIMLTMLVVPLPAIAKPIHACRPEVTPDSRLLGVQAKAASPLAVGRNAVKRPRNASFENKAGANFIRIAPSRPEIAILIEARPVL